MEPKIRYARTPDGVNLAYYSLGEGVPFVEMPTPLGHVLLEARSALGDGWCRDISSSMQFVRYDGRGFGLSTREVAEFSPELSRLDLETIVDALGLERFVLLAISSAAPAAVDYAVRNPDRVTHLILQDTAIRMLDISSRRRFMGPMIQAEPDLFYQTLADVTYGRGTKEADEWATLWAASAEPRTALRSMQAHLLCDMSEQLPLLRVPTLVLQTLESVSPTELITELAAAIPDAEFASVRAGNISELNSRVWDEVRRFLTAHGVLQDETEHSTPASPPTGQNAVASPFRTVLFTDIVGHTAIMQRLGDARGRDLLREHERITRDLLAEHSGAEVKTMGDGFMASFASVTRAMDCAIALQRAFAARDREPLQIRVGLNAGEPIEEDGDLFGAAVILASRICGQAGAGEILVPEPVRHLLAGKSYVYADRGDFIPKGFEDRMRLYEVRWQ